MDGAFYPGVKYTSYTPNFVQELTAELKNHFGYYKNLTSCTPSNVSICISRITRWNDRFCTAHEEKVLCKCREFLTGGSGRGFFDE
jgi:hypothetical protein